MINEQSILTDMNRLGGLDITDIKYSYYYNKVNEDLNVALYAKLIDISRCGDLRVELHSIRDSVDLVNYYKVFHEFYLWGKSPRDFLALVKMSDLLYCRKLCLNLNPFDSVDKVIGTTSVGFIKSCGLVIENLCREGIKEKDRSTRLQANLIMLRKIIMRSYLIPELTERAVEMAKLYYSWKLELIEDNRMYYRRRTPIPESELTPSKLSSSSIEDLIEKHTNNLEYFKEYYNVILFYHFYVTSNFREEYDRIKKEILELDLTDDQRNLILVSLDGTLASCNENKEEPYIIIMNTVYDNFAYFGCYDYNDLLSAVNLSQDFIETFSKIRLVEYALTLADMITISEEGHLVPNEAHDTILETHLELLVRYGVISENEMRLIFEKKRRSDYA